MNIEDSLNITRFIKDNKNNKTWQELADYTNAEFRTDLSKDAVRKRFNRELTNNNDTSYNTTSSAEFEEHKSNGEIILNKKVYFDSNVKKTPEIILNSLGYDPTTFELSEHRFGTWEVAMKDIDGIPTKTECCTIRAKVKPLKEKNINLKEIAEKLKEEAKVFETFKPNKIDYKALCEDNLLFIPSLEPHLNKFTNDFETGVNYNLKITLNRINTVYDNVEELQNIYKCNSCLMVIGSDYFHHESNNATAKGTPQKGEVSDNEMFTIGLDDSISRIKYLSETFNKVYILLQVGNHAPSNETKLYVSLSRIFSNYENVEFFENYQLTQAFKWGKTSLFFNHGDVNLKRLIGSITSEFHQVWGDTFFRYLIKGHLHIKEYTTDDNGINIITTPSICENDYWHKQERFGCGNVPSAELFVVNKNKGIIDDKIIPFTDQKVKTLKKEYIQGE